MKILNVNFTFNMIGEKLSDELSNLKELQKRGHDISTVTTDLAPYIVNQKKSNNTLFSNLDENRPVDIFGIPVYVLHCTMPNLGWYCPNASKLANNIVKNYDIIHIRNWYHHLAIEFYKAANKHNIPFVFTAHGTLDTVAREKYMKRIKIFIDKLYTKKMIRNASALHSLGDSENKEFLNFGASPNKIFRIDLGVKLKDLEISKDTDVFSKHGIDYKNHPYILFLGRVVKKKGLELLLNAFAKISHKDHHLVIAGPSDSLYQNELVQLSNNLGISVRVKFIGPVYGSEKAQLLQFAKVFALTSYSDIHPVAVEEALAMGNPVLITKNCDFPEIETYDAGVVVNADLNSVCDGLVKILADDEKIYDYSKNAKNLALKQFLFEDKVIEYENLFKFALDSHR